MNVFAAAFNPYLVALGALAITRSICLLPLDPLLAALEAFFKALDYV